LVVEPITLEFYYILLFTCSQLRLGELFAVASASCDHGAAT